MVRDSSYGWNVELIVMAWLRFVGVQLWYERNTGHYYMFCDELMSLTIRKEVLVDIVKCNKNNSIAV